MPNGKICYVEIPAKNVDASAKLTYIMVDSIDDTLEKVVAGGGRVTTPNTSLGDGEALATFSDPVGNVLGLYQEPRRA